MPRLTRLYSLRALALWGATAFAACAGTVGPVSTPSLEPEPQSPSLSSSPSPEPQSRRVLVQLPDADSEIFVYARYIRGLFPDTTAERFLDVRLPDFLISENSNYVFLLDSQADALRFDSDSLGVFLNGSRVVIDLSKGGAESWLGAASDAELAAVRGVRLSGDPVVDLEFLRRLTPPAPLAVMAEVYDTFMPLPVAAAILAARPAGLWAGHVEGLPELLATSSELRMLAIHGELAPLLPILPGLEILELGEGIEVDADLLASGTSLRVLVLWGPVRNVEELGRLANLRSLWVNWEGRRDLQPLLAMTGLEELTLVSDHAMTDISHIVAFPNLTALWIWGHSVDGLQGITRLAELPRLGLVVVDEDLLSLEEEQWDALRAARPDLRIEGYGFCVGSWLILLVLGLGVAAGLGARRHARLLACRHVGALPG